MKINIKKVSKRIRRDRDPPPHPHKPPSPKRPRLSSRAPIQTIQYALDKYKERMMKMKEVTKLVSKVKKSADKDEKKSKSYKLL